MTSSIPLDHHQDACPETHDHHKMMNPKTQRMEDPSFPSLDETEDSFKSVSSSSSGMGDQTKTYDFSMPESRSSPGLDTALHLLLTGGLLIMLVGYALHHDREPEERAEQASFGWSLALSRLFPVNNQQASSTARINGHSEDFPQPYMIHALFSAFTILLGYHLRNTIGKQYLGNISGGNRIATHRRSTSSTYRRKTSPNQPQHGNCDRPVLALTLEDECFVSLDTLADITLADVAHIFEFCNQLHRLSSLSSEKESLTLYVAEQEAKQPPLRPSLISVLEHLQEAVQTSRGPRVSMAHILDDSYTTNHAIAGDSMDALYLCGAIRLFAEWRSLRAIPSGYNKFAFGMTLTRRDVLQNAHKLEQAVHAYLLEDTTGGSKTTPTLRQLLEYEVASNRHPRLPCVEEESAGSGVVWATRQIIYYGKVLENNAQVPIRFPNPRAAVSRMFGLGTEDQRST